MSRSRHPSQPRSPLPSCRRAACLTDRPGRGFLSLRRHEQSTRTTTAKATAETTKTCCHAGLSAKPSSRRATTKPCEGSGSSSRFPPPQLHESVPCLTGIDPASSPVPSPGLWWGRLLAIFSSSSVVIFVSVGRPSLRRPSCQPKYRRAFGVRAGILDADYPHADDVSIYEIRVRLAIVRCIDYRLKEPQLSVVWIPPRLQTTDDAG